MELPAISPSPEFSPVILTVLLMFMSLFATKVSPTGPVPIDRAIGALTVMSPLPGLPLVPVEMVTLVPEFNKLLMSELIIC